VSFLLRSLCDFNATQKRPLPDMTTNTIKRHKSIAHQYSPWYHNYNHVMESSNRSNLGLDIIHYTGTDHVKLDLGNDSNVREILLEITLKTKLTSQTINIRPRNIDERAISTVHTREIYKSHDFLYYVTNIFSLSGPVPQILSQGDHEFPFSVKLPEFIKCS
jgi:hypothetical protein